MPNDFWVVWIRFILVILACYIGWHWDEIKGDY